MDRITRGMVGGTIGCMLKSMVNAASNRLGIMGMRNSTVGTDLVLGKTMIKRKGAIQWLVGEIASSQLGCFWGGFMAMLPPASEANVWIVRGVMGGSLAWFVDMGLGARAIPRAVQGDVTPRDALMWWAQHMVFGLVASYYIDRNPNMLSDIKNYITGKNSQSTSQLTNNNGADVMSYRQFSEQEQQPFLSPQS